MGVGDKIKTLRKSMGLTQTELGERVGVKKNAVSKWECGRVEDIPTSTIKALAALFGVPASYLIDDDSEEQPLVNDDEELTEYLEDLKTRPELRMLFQLSRNATVEEVEQAVRIIEALRKK